MELKALDCEVTEGASAGEADGEGSAESNGVDTVILALPPGGGAQLEAAMAADDSDVIMRQLEFKAHPLPRPRTDPSPSLARSSCRRRSRPA